MTVIRTLMVIVFLCLMYATVSFAETSPAFIRQELKKTEKIWPGQRQTLSIKLYTSTSFSGSTRFELPEVSGMLIMESEDRPLLGTEKIDGGSYIFKQHEITLFPLRAGSLTVPPFTVEFGFRGPENKVAQQSFTTSELQFTVEKIPGTDPQRPVITTTNLHVDDHWQPVPGKAKVGDAFTRTITMTGVDLPGMAFPPLNVQKIEGVGLYTKQPQVADQMQRGEFTGKRIETISYVCEQQGTFTVPEAQIQWWNPKTESLQNITLETVELKVAANSLLQKESPMESNISRDARFPWKWVVLILLFSALAVAAFIWQRRTMKQQSSQVKDIEKELFKEFEKVSVSHDAAATMQALCHWLDYSELTGSSGSLARFIELADDSELTIQIEALETTLYATGQKQHWSGDKLYSSVQRARKKLKQYKPLGVQHSLPPLNP
ncbi:MAG: hypothetical protein U9P36_11990 [Thermodesulfobacteriota bacterium]|nr:hypothetical protein [Thermodesulfobacteriota bacterium]